MMQGEIITTGDELLTGRVGDFNARYAARRLHEAGLPVQRLTILGDHSPLFQDLLAEALVRSQFIIITGGLRPTEDDITVVAAAQALNLRLLCDEVLLARIRRCLGERRIPWEERYARRDGIVNLHNGLAAHAIETHLRAPPRLQPKTLHSFGMQAHGQLSDALRQQLRRSDGRPEIVQLRDRDRHQFILLRTKSLP